MSGVSSKELYQDYVNSMRKIADIRFSSAVLQWDQETYLPTKGASIRGQQIATLSELAHHYFTDDRLGGVLKELMGRDDLSPDNKRNVELTLEDFDKQKKFSSAFVRQLSEAINKSFHSWIEARKANDFSVFEKDLALVTELKKQEAEFLGYTDHPYDALLNDHDKGATKKKLDELFGSLRSPLKTLLDNVISKPEVSDEFLHQHYPKDKQWQFGMQLLKEIGFDFEAGRQDISEHPFSISFNCADVRITTRIDESNLSSMVWSCIHELGHAFYEQGLPESEYGLPLGEAASYSIHESQSRLWENHVGRSLAFCEKYLPLLKEYFPEQLKQVNADQFFKAINKVKPSLIRTEADELTYHFHVMIRYEIEKKLIEGSISTKDIPAYWNDHYLQYLGVKVPDDKQGCLQDVHWSHGSFGYFPTYSLGSFYAAQFYGTAAREIPLEEQIRKGQFQPLLSWLRNAVHQHGRKYPSEELCLKISEKALNTEYFLTYLLDKYRNIYQL